MIISLADIAPQGQSFTVDDPAIWAGPWTEFGMPCRMAEPLRAEIFVLPQDDGCLVRGRLQGSVTVPCNRCAEDALVPVDVAFDEFEEYPPLLEGEDDEEGEEPGDVLVRENGRLMLDIGALLWEEFSLALPVKPLCTPGCRGVCPVCGQNQNVGSCACAASGGDPRFAILREKNVK